MKSLRTWLLAVGVALATLGTSGCNPFAMGIATPIPVQPWMADQLEARLDNP